MQAWRGLAGLEGSCRSPHRCSSQKERPRLRGAQQCGRNIRPRIIDLAAGVGRSLQMAAPGSTPPGNWQSHLGYCNNYPPTTRATPPSVVPYFPAQDPQNALFYFSIPCTFDSAVCGGLSASRLKAVPLVTSYSQRRFREAILSPKPTDKRPWKPPASSPSTVTFPHGRPNIGYPSVDVDNPPSLNPDAKREEPPITIHLPNEPEAKHVVD